jgi:hypothetical protein
MHRARCRHCGAQTTRSSCVSCGSRELLPASQRSGALPWAQAATVGARATVAPYPQFRGSKR